MSARIRVLLAKPGIDGHTRGIRVVARAMTNAGFEVIYLGMYQTPEQIVDAAVQEDVDVIGLGALSGVHHVKLYARIIELLHEHRAPNIVVLAGGNVRSEDVPTLKALGVAEVFGPGSSTNDIIAFVQRAVGERTSEALGSRRD